MNIFSRFKDIINSNINAMLDKAEDPEKMLRLMIQEMEDTLIELKTSCASSIAEGTKIENDLHNAEEIASRWEKRAVLALEKAQEDLTREALAEKIAAEKEAKRLRNLLDENRNTIKESRREIEELEEKLSETKARFSVLKEKEERARNEKRAREQMHHDMEARFREMEEKIGRMNGWNDISSSSSYEKFRKMEKDDEIEKELRKLKKKAGK